MERTKACKNNTGRKENLQKNARKTDQNVNKVVSVDFFLSILAFLYIFLKFMFNMRSLHLKGEPVLSSSCPGGEGVMKSNDKNSSD